MNSIYDERLASRSVKLLRIVKKVFDQMVEPAKNCKCHKRVGAAINLQIGCDDPVATARGSDTMQVGRVPDDSRALSPVGLAA